MSDLPGETHAIAVALNVARQYGYGNLISRLQEEWSKKLQENSGLSKDAADGGAWKPSWFWGRIDQLKERNARLEAVLASAEAFLASFPKHYHGFPGKLQWWEIHALKQSIEAARAVDAGGGDV